VAAGASGVAEAGTPARSASILSYRASSGAERFAAGRSMNSLVTGLAQQGAEISPATLSGMCAQAGLNVLT